MQDEVPQETLTPKEGTVLSPEGDVLLGQEASRDQRGPRFRSFQYSWKSQDMGFLPKVIFGALFSLVFLGALLLTLLLGSLAMVGLLIRKLFRF